MGPRDARRTWSLHYFRPIRRGVSRTHFERFSTAASTSNARTASAVRRRPGSLDVCEIYVAGVPVRTDGTGIALLVDLMQAALNRQAANTARTAPTGAKRSASLTATPTVPRRKRHAGHRNVTSQHRNRRRASVPTSRTDHLRLTASAPCRRAAPMLCVNFVAPERVGHCAWRESHTSITP